MRAEIISTGTEILLGHITNTNSSYLSAKLASLGIDVYYHTAVGDNPGRIVSSVKKAFLRSDIVITTGGLGPTVDDSTLSSLCKAVSKKPVFNKKIAKHIKQYFERRGFNGMPDDALRQAYVPKGAFWFENRVGTAPAILLRRGKKLLIALPGPPRELKPLFENAIIPYLGKNGFAGKWTIKTKTLKVAGLVEAEVNTIVKDLLSMRPQTTLGIYTRLGEVDLKITAKAKNEKAADKNIKKVEKEIRNRLGNYVYGVDEQALEDIVGKILTRNKMTLALAESCTGGLVANRITSVSGSSFYFKEGIIAYSNKAKTELLGISAKKLKKYGAVSKEIAREMAKAVRKLAKTDISVGITGIAGPTGATRKKPIGLVYIALYDDKINIVKECRFEGNRQEIKHQASTVSLDLIRTASYAS